MKTQVVSAYLRNLRTPVIVEEDAQRLIGQIYEAKGLANFNEIVAASGLGGNKLTVGVEVKPVLSLKTQQEIVLAFSKRIMGIKQLAKVILPLKRVTKDETGTNFTQLLDGERFKENLLLAMAMFRHK